MARPNRQQRVYVTVVGQDDNLGDSVLRRGLLDTLDRDAVQVHVRVDGNSAAYQSALGLHAEDVVYASRRAWRLSLVRSAARGRTSLLFNPGEVQLDAEQSHLGLVQAALVVLVRLRAGGVVHTGIGIRDPQGEAKAAQRAVLRLCNLITWRDQASRACAGLGDVAPDWAFALGSPGGRRESSRDRMAVCMRGDRPFPSRVWFEVVQAAATEQSLRPVLVVQVRRDAERARAIADHMGSDVDVIEWPEGASHTAHEQTLRAVYRSCAAVVSDRLHALVIGATEGAVPLGLATQSVEKVRRTLRPASLDDACLVVDEMSDPQVVMVEVRRALEGAPRLCQRVSDAQRELLALGRTSAAHLGSGGR